MADEHVLVPFKKRHHDHRRCIDAALAEAQSLCRRRGLRLTSTRERVLELVWANHAPVKAYEILEGLQKEHPRAAPPTVYRALDFLLDAGLIHRLESCNAYTGCGDPRSPHVGQFLICRKCGAVAEISDPSITQLLTQEAAVLEFEVDRPTVEIRGLCPECH